MGKPVIEVITQWYKKKVGYHLLNILECDFDTTNGNKAKFYPIICITIQIIHRLYYIAFKCIIFIDRFYLDNISYSMNISFKKYYSHQYYVQLYQNIGPVLWRGGNFHLHRVTWSGSNYK